MREYPRRRFNPIALTNIHACVSAITQVRQLGRRRGIGRSYKSRPRVTIEKRWRRSLCPSLCRYPPRTVSPICYARRGRNGAFIRAAFASRRFSAQLRLHASSPPVFIATSNAGSAPRRSGNHASRAGNHRVSFARSRIRSARNRTVVSPDRCKRLIFARVKH